MQGTKIRIGIISTANIGIRSMVPSILDLSNNFQLVGIAGRNIEKTKKVAHELNIAAFESYNSLIDKKIVDAVYVPLPNSLHFEWVRKALKEGLHVLVEKSLGCSLEEVDWLNKYAAEKNLALLENFQFRFHNQLAFIKKLLKDGFIGELRSLRSSFGFPGFVDESNIRYKKELGGGSLLDAGAYTIKVAQEFLGNDLTVSAGSLFVNKEKGIDMYGGGFLKQKNGDLYAQVSFGFDNYYQCNLELWGSKGKIYTNRIFTARADHQPEIVVETNGADMEILRLETDDHFKKMLIYFYNLIEGKENKEKEYLQNVNQARLIEELKNKAYA